MHVMTEASYLLQILRFMHRCSKIAGNQALSTAQEEEALSAMNCTDEKGVK